MFENDPLLDDIYGGSRIFIFIIYIIFQPGLGKRGQLCGKDNYVVSLAIEVLWELSCHISLGGHPLGAE